MRLLSFMLFALMAMVLPMAGVQHYFCTSAMVFVDGANDCPVEKKKCCGKNNKEKSDCLVSTKLLPNGEESSPLQIPVAGAWSIASVSPVDLIPVIRVGRISPEKDRGPPDLPGLYLLQSSLLI